MVKIHNNKFFIYTESRHEVISENTDVLNICIISDDNYFKYLLIALNSIIRSKKQETRIEFFLILDNVTQTNKLKLKAFDTKSTMINVIEYSSSYDKLASEESKYITPSTYIRLDIPNLVPKTVQKLLYLDCDIIVRQDLSELYDISLSYDQFFAAVRDFSISCLHKNNPAFRYLLKEMDDIDYFNAGIILMDLQKMRRDSFCRKAYECYKAHPEFKFADQDILNFLYRKKTKYISCKYNFQVLYSLQNCEWSRPANDIGVYKRLFDVKYDVIEDMIFDIAVIHLLGNKQDMYLKYGCIRNMIDREAEELKKIGVTI